HLFRFGPLSFSCDPHPARRFVKLAALNFRLSSVRAAWHSAQSSQLKNSSGSPHYAAFLRRDCDRRGTQRPDMRLLSGQGWPEGSRARTISRGWRNDCYRRGNAARLLVGHSRERLSTCKSLTGPERAGFACSLRTHRTDDSFFTCLSRWRHY